MTSQGERGLRVAICAAYPFEDRITGGLEGVAVALADGLANVPGIDVHVVACIKGLANPVERYTPTGVKLHFVPSPGKRAWLIGFPVEARWVQTVLREIAPDIVHCHSQTLYPYAALERGWPSVMTVHGIYALEVALTRGWERLRGTMVQRFERDALRRARHIICISRYLIDVLGHSLRTDDIRYIENPVDDRFFDIVVDEEAERILYAGTIIRRKNLLNLLQAVKLLASSRPGIKLKVAGNGSAQPDYYKLCLDFVNQNGLKENVDFLGGVSPDGLRDELSKAMMLVLPALQETAPLIISEAQAAGRPVIATPAGGTAYMVEHDKTGLIVPFDDANALADSINVLLNDDDKRRRMGENARQEAEKRYRRSAVVEKTVEYYREILATEGCDPK